MSYLLAIESSCDETSAAILDGDTILSNIVSSQIDTHKQFGGVVPEVASRLHAECIHHVIEKACKQANVTFNDLNAIAVTIGPGLEGCLLVGISVAKSLALLLDIPLIPINHLHGHIFAHRNKVKDVHYPCIAAIVSGGHTELILMKNAQSFEKIGKTRDDAAGEVFDKVARHLNLGYPGGPVIEKTAVNGNPNRFKFPIPMKKTPYEFSFSGLKTAVIDCVNNLDNINDHIPDICASFQHTVIQTLTFKAIQACQLQSISTLIISGGVFANQALQTHFVNECKKEGIRLVQTEKKLCTDNAAMIGLAANQLKSISDVSIENVRVKASLRI